MEITLPACNREQPPFMVPASTVTHGTQNKRRLEDTAELQRRARTRPADHVETPGLLHVLQRVPTARSRRRRLPQTSTNKGHSALFGKREGDRSSTWMAYCTDAIAECCICLSYNVQQNNNYICQFHQTLHTGLERSIKWNFSFLRRKNAESEAGNKPAIFTMEQRT